MKKKFKVIPLLVVAVMLFSSLSIFAETVSQSFGTTSSSVASLAAGDQWARATTTRNSGTGSISTLLRLGNNGGVSSWRSGTKEISMTNVESGLSGAATYAQSVHYVGSDSIWLYADM